MNRYFNLAVFLTVTNLLAGCINHSAHKENAKSVDINKQQSKKLLAKNPVFEPAFVRLTRPPIDTTPISDIGDPQWFAHSYKTSSSMPFGLIVRNAFEGSNVVTSFDEDLDQNRLVSVIYDGTLRGLLDELSLASGFAYSINGNRVRWHRLTTKIIEVGILPGKNSLQFGSLEESSQSENNGEVQTVVRSSKDSYFQTSAVLDPWADLTKMVASMVSEEGKIFVSESAGTVTITDYPARVNKVSNVLESYAKRMKQQAILLISIINVEHEKGRADSIDWNLVKQSVSKTIEFGTKNSDPFTIFNEAPSIINFKKIDGSTAGSNVLLQAIDEQAKATLSITPRMVAMHNQVSEYNVTTDTGYLASSNTTTNENTTDTALQGGIITTGITIHLLSQIDAANEEVYFDLIASISDLRDLKLIESNNSSIQNPEVDKTQVKHRGRVRSGETLLLSGLERVIADTRSRENFDTGVLGVAHSNHKKIETLVLITPVIMN